MKVQIKRFDPSLPLPEYKTSGAAAVDVCGRETVTIAPRQVAMVPLNVAIKLPPGYWLLMAARSSLFKKGVCLINGIGVGDEDFSGDGDEYRAALFNYTDQPVTIERGDRIVQMLLMNREKFEWQEVAKLDDQDRGGFGSTG